jgi:phosphoglycerate dehydrogenase-like enzyme
MLPQADVVVIAAPLTPETQGMFGKEAFAAMKKGAFFVNVSRGAIVVQEELIAALQSGKLAGACLDVTDPEPLPASSPLWGMRNVVITPHMAADGEVTETRMWTLLRENLRRFAAGEPLYNVVDKQAGY